MTRNATPDATPAGFALPGRGDALRRATVARRLRALASGAARRRVVAALVTVDGWGYQDARGRWYRADELGALPPGVVLRHAADVLGVVSPRHAAGIAQRNGAATAGHDAGHVAQLRHVIAHSAPVDRVWQDAAAALLQLDGRAPSVMGQECRGVTFSRGRGAKFAPRPLYGPRCGQEWGNES